MWLLQKADVLTGSDDDGYSYDRYNIRAYGPFSFDSELIFSDSNFIYKDLEREIYTYINRYSLFLIYININ